MSTVKTKIDQELVLSFLEKYFSEQVSDLIYIKGGEGSQAFSFSVTNKPYVIRVNSRNYSFLKDQFAVKYFQSELVPIPKIVEVGMLNDKYHYALSERVPGKRLDEFSEEEQAVIRPQLFETLEAIHATDISFSTGYGHWNENGIAPRSAWKEVIVGLDGYATGKEGRPNFFETTFLEKEVWDKVYGEIVKLVPFISEERHLLHGDYGFDNMLSDGKKISGVIDWGESSYGDFLYDYAWLSYWSKDQAYRTFSKEYFTSENIEVPHFEERMKCYELHIGLGALGFYAFSEQRETYEWNKARLLGLLNQL
jgi:hygromycin-B 4-O-kinase